VNMKLLFSFLFSISCLVAFAQGIDFVPEDAKWQDILAKAKAENKVVFVDAYTTWCGPCKVMAKNIFPLKEVGDVFNAKFVNAKIDMEKGEGLDIAKKYNIRAYPTYIFVNGDGELVHKGLGSMPAPKFIEVGNAAADPERQFFTQKKKYEAGNNSQEFLKKFSTACREIQESKLAEEVANTYLKGEKDWLTQENMTYISGFVKNIDSDLFKFVLKNRAAFENQLGVPLVGDMLEGNAIRGLAGKFYNRRDASFEKEKAIEYAKSINLPNDITEKATDYLQMFSYQNKRDMPNYLKAAVAFYDKYPPEDTNTLNSVAWTFYESTDDRLLLEKALAWSLKSIGISPQYPFLDTAAAIYFKLGNKQKAKEYAEKAISKAKETGEDAAETEALLKKIEAM
jgi:thioredoxin-related protein